MISEVFNVDCLTYMRGLPDKFFELAVVDPPYGIGRFGDRAELSNRLCKTAKLNKWDTKPTKEYFEELFRVSKNQIIWGANNFELPTTEYFCVWDKKQTVQNFASAEYAWVSMGLKKPAIVFEYSIHNVMQDRKQDGGKIHPTQKPVALYRWILENYAKAGDKIFDSHMGSQSSRIAAWQMGFDYYGCELDTDYFIEGNKRFEREKIKQQLFTPEQVRATQTKLL